MISLIKKYKKEIQNYYLEQKKAKEDSLKQEILMRKDLDKIKAILVKIFIIFVKNL